MINLKDLAEDVIFKEAHHQESRAIGGAAHHRLVRELRDVHSIQYDMWHLLCDEISDLHSSR